MNRLTLSWCLGAALLLAGCGEKNEQAGTPTESGKQSLVQATAQPNPLGEGVHQPPDAQWTIACMGYSRTGHVERSKTFRQQLTASTGLKGFYVVHEEGISTIYYGFYRVLSTRSGSGEKVTEEDIKEGKRAQADLQKIRSLRDATGDPLFTSARFSPLEPVDPPAPAEWDLRNVDRNKPDSDPSKAFWALEIGIYKDDNERSRESNRKKDAVESVRMLRESGIKDVYFYHGKTASSIIIGTWPREAVKEQDSTEVGSIDPDQRLLVLAQRFPAGVVPKLRDSEGKSVRAMAPRLEPVDPTLIDHMARYDRRSVNGNDIKRTYRKKNGATVDIFEPSLVILIPRGGEGMLDGGDRSPTDDPLYDTGRSPLTNPGTGGGRLRSLDR